MRADMRICQACGAEAHRIMIRANGGKCDDCVRAPVWAGLKADLDKYARMAPEDPAAAMRGLLAIDPEDARLTPELKARHITGVAKVGAILQEATGQPLDANPLVAAAQNLGFRVLESDDVADDDGFGRPEPPKPVQPDLFQAKFALDQARGHEAAGRNDAAWRALRDMQAVMTPQQRETYRTELARAVMEVDRKAEES